MTTTAAAPPAWWSDPATRILDPATPASAEANYAPANLGQLKNVAKRAAAHLDAHLPGGAGPAVTALVAGFATSPAAENYAPINLGQLKATAKPFYARLQAAGYDTRANLLARGFTGAGPYPWNPATPAAENYAPANLGQLKMAFSFDLSGFESDEDTDDDGFSDHWEQEVFGDLTHDSSTDTDGDGVTDFAEVNAGTDWNDFWNGAPPVLVKVGGDNQGDLAGTTLTLPLKVQLRNSSGTAALSGNVTFSVTPSSGGSLSPAGSILVDTQGVALTALTLPSNASAAGSAVMITATAGNNFGLAQVTFTAFVGDPLVGPSKPSNVQVSLSADESEATLTWTDNSFNETAYYVERTEDNVTWIRRATLQPNATSYTDSGLQYGRCYIYRVKSHN